MKLGIDGRVAIVAASSQGLGRAVAFGFAREGVKLAICARREQILLKTADEIRRETGVPVFALPVDVRDQDAVSEFVHRAHKEYSRIDICVTNAGGPPAKTFAETTAEDWRAAVDLNLLSTVAFAREVLPIMRTQRWGRFLTITSVSVKQPLPGMILSNSVRAGVLGLVKSLANEYGPDNILVNNVCPGFTMTERLKEFGGKVPLDQIPLRRAATPEEFADLVVFLASERASYITGASIAADGGFSRGL